MALKNISKVVIFVLCVLLVSVIADGQAMGEVLQKEPAGASSSAPNALGRVGNIFEYRAFLHFYIRWDNSKELKTCGRVFYKSDRILTIKLCLSKLFPKRR